MRKYIVFLGLITCSLTACGGGETASGSGTGGGGAGGAGGTSTSTTPAGLVAACLTICDKGYNPSCQGITLDVCKMACPNLASEIDPLCLDLGTQFYECGAQFDYTCGENGPTPVAGTGPDCVDVVQAYLDCEDTAPCKSYCAQANECEGAPVDECVASCTLQSDPGSYDCAFDFEQLLDCQLDGNLMCSGGALGAPACASQQESLNDCLGIVPPFCDTYCGAPLMGCAPDMVTCKSTCESELAAAAAKGCDAAFSALRTCQSTEALPCDGAEPSIVGCSEEVVNYNSCMGIGQ